MEMSLEHCHLLVTIKAVHLIENFQRREGGNVTGRHSHVPVESGTSSQCETSFSEDERVTRTASLASLGQGISATPTCQRRLLRNMNHCLFNALSYINPSVSAQQLVDSLPTISRDSSTPKRKCYHQRAHAGAGSHSHFCSCFWAFSLPTRHQKRSLTMPAAPPATLVDQWSHHTRILLSWPTTPPNCPPSYKMLEPS